MVEIIKQSIQGFYCFILQTLPNRETSKSITIRDWNSHRTFVENVQIIYKPIRLIVGWFLVIVRIRKFYSMGYFGEKKTKNNWHNQSTHTRIPNVHRRNNQFVCHWANYLQKMIEKMRMKIRPVENKICMCLVPKLNVACLINQLQKWKMAYNLRKFGSMNVIGWCTAIK